jgi:hypothetical protein
MDLSSVVPVIFLRKGSLKNGDGVKQENLFSAMNSFLLHL